MANDDDWNRTNAVYTSGFTVHRLCHSATSSNVANTAQYIKYTVLLNNSIISTGYNMRYIKKITLSKYQQILQLTNIINVDAESRTQPARFSAESSADKLRRQL